MGRAMSYAFTILNSPVGALKLVATDHGLAAVLWEDDDPKRVRLGEMSEVPRHPVLCQTRQQLDDYFAGRRMVFTVPLDMRGTTFQKAVWASLLCIPFGETRTYAQIAEDLDNPAAVRAVGAANGRNPVSIIAPCHRVLGSDGSLTGFAGGLQAKAWLLAHEGHARFATAI